MHYTAKLSSKNQITLPVDLIKRLNLHKGGSITLELQKHEVVMMRPQRKSLVERVGGSLYNFVPKDKLNIAFSVARADTQRIVAQDLAKQGLGNKPSV